jgi:peptide/nickel transport system ATP-binding protein
MYAGRIAEIGPVREVVKNAKHPYTAGLMGSIPAIGGPQGKLTQIEGNMPRLTEIPPGCAYNPRCPRAGQRCLVERPDLIQAGIARAACWLYDPAGVGQPLRQGAMAEVASA